MPLSNALPTQRLPLRGVFVTFAASLALAAAAEDEERTGAHQTAKRDRSEVTGTRVG